MCRKAQILAIARRDGRVMVDALATRLGVSAHTIRRDLNALCAEEKLRRLHGGAEYVEADQNLPYGTRSVMNARQKRAIARAVAEIVPDGATVFVSIGTTPAIVAAALSSKRDLTVITNNLNAANALAIAERRGIRIVLPGGEMRLPDRDIVGEDVLRMFEGYRADFGIYGVGGIERDGTLLDFHASEVRIREQIRRNSRASVLVADCSKFARAAAAAGSHLAEVDIVVLDRRPEPPFDALVAGLPGRVIYADAPGAPGADADAEPSTADA
ncbi:MAG: DeoR/GlpR family DNA-binding transcription regulator [Paracoccaceae bacterium]